MSLPAGVKLGILCLAIVALLAALCFAAAPLLISTDAIRLRLARDLSSMTGYNVQLREPPRIRIFPFQANLGNVILTDDNPSDAPLMEARDIIVRMPLWDAISGRARFTETQLIAPRFNLSEPLTAASLSAAFARSHGSFGSALRAAQNTAQAAAGGQKPLLTQPFGRIIIEDGRIDYPVSPNAEAAASRLAKPAEAAAPAREEISNIQAELNWPRTGAQASLTASGIWHGAQTSLDISADDALMLLSGGKTHLRISFNSAKGGITFTGAGISGANWQARGRIEARSPGLDQTLSWLQIRPPFGLAFTSPFTWASELKASAAGAELGNITLILGDDTNGDSGRGAVDIAYENGLPHISGSLAFEKLNLSLPAPALFVSPRRSGGSPIVDMPIFNLLGLDIRVSAGQAQFNGAQAQDIAASIQMRPSGLIFDIGTMRIFGGTAQTSLRLASDDDRITALEARLSTAGADLGQMRRAFGSAWPQQLKFDGRANIGLNMQANLPKPTASAAAAKWPLPAPKPKRATETAAGAAAVSETAAANSAAGYYAIFSRDIWPYARGQLNFTVNNGRLANFDMADFLSRLQAGAAFPLLMPRAKAGDGNMPAFSFSRLEGQIPFANGALGGAAGDKPAPISATVLFDRHRLELIGTVNSLNGIVALAGTLDPLPLDKNGQCPDTACLIRSLSPVLRFAAQNSGAAAAGFIGPIPPAPAAAPADAALNRKDNAPTAPGSGIEIVPQAGILP